MKTIITRLVFGVLLVSHAAQAQVVDNRDFEIDRVRPTTSIDGTLNVSSPTLAPRHSWNAMVAMGYSRNLLLLRQDIDGAASRDGAAAQSHDPMGRWQLCGLAVARGGQ
ncbi:MAG: hypothetical protein R3C68_15435 [Myxococcota bacterium]